MALGLLRTRSLRGSPASSFTIVSLNPSTVGLRGVEEGNFVTHSKSSGRGQCLWRAPTCHVPSGARTLGQLSNRGSSQTHFHTL